MNYRYLIFPIITFALLLTTIQVKSFAAEGAKLGVKADFRWRMEGDGKDFDSDTDTRTFNLLRARTGLQIQQGDVTAFTQVQVSKQLDWDSKNLADNPIGVHQAYLHINHCLFQPGLSLKVGRFELQYGDERLVGPVGWSNVGRTFEGLVLRKETNAVDVDIFATRQIDRSVGFGANAPSDQFLGLWGFVKPIKLDLFFLHNIGLAPIREDDYQVNLSRSTLGLHYKNKYESGIGTNLDLAYQIGTNKNLSNSPATETDIAAWMALVEIWYKFNSPINPKLALGADIASGDDPTTPDKWEAFDNLYYTGHAFRGNMDYFVASNSEGLRDIYLKALIKPLPVLNVALAVHNFAAMEDSPNVDAGKKATDFGNEINFDINANVRENLLLSLGVGYFLPAEDWKGKDAENAFWGYLSLHTKMDIAP